MKGLRAFTLVLTTVLVVASLRAAGQGVGQSCVNSTCTCPDGRRVTGGCDQDCAAACGASSAPRGSGFNPVQQAQLQGAYDVGHLIGASFVNWLLSPPSNGDFQHQQGLQQQRLLQYQHELQHQQDQALLDAERGRGEKWLQERDRLNASLKGDAPDQPLAIKDEGPEAELALKDSDAERRRREGFREAMEQALRAQRQSLLGKCDFFQVCWKSSMGQIELFRAKRDLLERDLAHQKDQLRKLKAQKTEGAQFMTGHGGKTPIDAARDAIERDQQAIAALKKFEEGSRSGLDPKRPPDAIIVGGADGAQIRGPDGAWRPLGAKIFMRNDDEVRTAHGSSLKLMYQDNGKVEIGPGKDFIIDTSGEPPAPNAPVHVKG